MAKSATKKFPWIIYWILFFLILLLALAPLGSVMLAGSLANAYGCQLDEGSVHPCVIAGQDRGELLLTMFVLGWFMLITLPAGVVALVVWLVALIVHRVLWRNSRAARADG